MKTVIVNATALDASGALTILNQFIENIPNSEIYYIIFISTKFKAPDFNSRNIKFIPLAVKSWHQRILWDFYGLNKWMKKNSVNPELIISLQNTSIYSSKNENQIIYLHQSIPFSDKRWRVYKREEYKLFLYKIFYKFFIFLFINKKTVFVVQTNWMKEKLQKYGIDKNNIMVISPSLKKQNMLSLKYFNLPKERKVIFYPATSLIYKNHLEIINALYLLKYKNIDISNILCVFTIDEKSNHSLLKKINDYKLIDNFLFIGSVSYEEVLSLYQQCSVVMFPSYIETFGLPLREAALLGKPIIASDQAYAREVLCGYSGATFAKFGDSDAWANAMIKLIAKDEEYPPIKDTISPSWQVLFNYIENEIIK
jgi:glycosyltransferase involved in cell wall biosynthesis